MMYSRVLAPLLTAALLATVGLAITPTASAIERCEEEDNGVTWTETCTGVANGCVYTVTRKGIYDANGNKRETYKKKDETCIGNAAP